VDSVPADLPAALERIRSKRTTKEPGLLRRSSDTPLCR
jgi:hypothetical protein